MKVFGITFLNTLKTFFIPCSQNGFYPHSLRKQALLFYALIVVAVKALSLGSGYLFPQTSFFADVSQQLVLYLTNQERQGSGLAVLRENPVLNAAAKQKAQDMVANNYFAHVSPQGVTPWYWFKTSGYSYRYAGENLAVDFLESSDVVNAWMNSPGHRQNILNDKYQEIGVAVMQGMIDGQNTTVVVQLFGSPKVAVAQPSATPVPSVQPSPTVKPSPTIKPSPTVSQSPIASPVVSPAVSIAPTPIASPQPLFTAEPIVAGETNNQPTPSMSPVATPYAGPVLTRQSAVAGARTMSAWNFVVDTMSNPAWMYWAILGYLVLVAILGIFSRVYTPQPSGFVGVMLLIVFTATMLAMPDTDQLLQWSVRVL